MAKQFEDQGGMATSDPSPILRWVTSRFATRLASRSSLERQRARVEKKRRRAGHGHRIEYFHQIDDGYSHLAAQLLRPVLESYDVDLVFQREEQLRLGQVSSGLGGNQMVVEAAGLSWEVARGFVGNRDWEDALEENRLAMYGFGCWGVPSFRLLDERGEQVLALWGQDRLWLFSREIQRLLRERAG
jgi:2-hydroxychromene-2-carboxylate isomerase